MARRISHSLLWAAALWAASWAALPDPAQAQARTTTAVNLRAGPGVEYPIVAWLPQATRVEVHGCVERYEWCDVTAPDVRGWVHAAYLAYPYRNRPVPIITYGALIGLPIIIFSIGPYWDDHYRNRPWYSQRPRWEHRGPPPLRPRQPPGPPPGGWSGPGHRPGIHPPGIGSARPPGSMQPPRPPTMRPPAGMPPPDREPRRQPPAALPPGGAAPGALPPGTQSRDRALPPNRSSAPAGPPASARQQGGPMAPGAGPGGPGSRAGGAPPSAGRSPPGAGGAPGAPGGQRSGQR